LGPTSLPYVFHHTSKACPQSEVLIASSRHQRPGRVHLGPKFTGQLGHSATRAGCLRHRRQFGEDPPGPLPPTAARLNPNSFSKKRPNPSDNRRGRVISTARNPLHIRGHFAHYGPLLNGTSDRSIDPSTRSIFAGRDAHACATVPAKCCGPWPIRGRT
jgi:hypothetical protein